MKKLALAAVTTVFVLGCNSEQKTEGNAGTGPSTSAGPTFASLESGIFGPKCVMCHGENGKGGIDLRTYASAMKGGEEGPIIKAGDAAGSQIVKALHGQGAKQMPMNSNPLPAEEIKQVEDWIAAGAKES